MTTAPKGAAPEAIRSRLDTAVDSLPPAASQPKSHAAQRLNKLTAKLDALCVWKEDIQRRIADVDAWLWEPNWFFSRVYQDEIDDLADATRAWRLAAARVVVDIVHQDDMRREV